MNMHIDVSYSRSKIRFVLLNDNENLRKNRKGLDLDLINVLYILFKAII